MLYFEIYEAFFSLLIINKYLNMNSVKGFLDY